MGVVIINKEKYVIKWEIFFFFFIGWIKIKMGKVDMPRNRIKIDVGK